MKPLSACGYIRISGEKHTGRHACKYSKHIKLGLFGIWELKTNLIGFRRKINSCNITLHLTSRFNMPDIKAIIASVGQCVRVCLHHLPLLSVLCNMFWGLSLDIIAGHMTRVWLADMSSSAPAGRHQNYTLYCISETNTASLNGFDCNDHRSPHQILLKPHHNKPPDQPVSETLSSCKISQETTWSWRIM